MLVNFFRIIGIGARGEARMCGGVERDKKRQKVTGETFFQQRAFKSSLLGKTDFGSNHSSVIYCLWMIHSISILPMCIEGL